MSKSNKYIVNEGVFNSGVNYLVYNFKNLWEVSYRLGIKEPANV